ncbi:MAG: ATP-binding protein [Acidobacteriota bacterium]
MRLQSWRARVTSWYVLVLVFVVATLAGGGWWLMSRTVTDAADRDLAARLTGLHHFIDGMKAETNPQEVLDEFREYGELTSGESLIEVIDPAGQVLLRPSVPWWDELDAAPRSHDARPSFRTWTRGDRQLRVVDGGVDVDGRIYRVTLAVPTAALQVAVHQFGVLLMILAPAVLVVAGLGVYIISRQALAPVEEIRRAAEAITVEHLDRRLVVPAIDDELRRLVVTFNAMLARLEQAVANIVRFTSDASHELRTPVALIRTTAELAIDRERDPEQYRQALVEVAAEAGRMSTLVDDLLRLARADAGVDDAGAGQQDIRDVVAVVVAGIRPVADGKHVCIRVDQPPEPVPVFGHERSLVRLMRAVLDNAVKYTPEGGRISVAVAVTETTSAVPVAVVRVADSGSGVSPDDAPRIFDRFFRGRDARARGFDGSGLGLSMARTLAERAGGSIRLLPPAEPGGATFEIRLPSVRGPSGSG